MLSLNKKYKRIIVTSGDNYTDIDAYAGCIVYTKILRKLGFNAISYSSSKLNGSVPNSIYNTNLILREYKYEEGDKYIIIDVSANRFIDPIVKDDDVIELIDHHFGFEEYWKSRLGDSSIIEQIGAVATIITEYAVETKYIDEMPKEEILLLMGAILDNTLNFKAKITTKRDIEAYNLLQEKSGTEHFDEYYFKECEKDLLKDFRGFVKLETNTDGVGMIPKYFSQIVLYDKSIIDDKYSVVDEELEKFGKDWIINIIDLNRGKSYIYSINPEPKGKMEKLFNKNFNSNNILELDGLYLRKEIKKIAQEII